MRKDDCISNAEIFALSKMDPVSKRSDNTQIILMYERISAGRRQLEKAFDQLLDAVINRSNFDLKLMMQIKVLEKIQSTMVHTWKDISESGDAVRNIREQNNKQQSDKVEQGLASLSEAIDTLKQMRMEGLTNTREFCAISTELGSLSQDPFYVMDNAIFRNKLLGAVTCHKEWMKMMRKLIDTKGQMPEQMNEHLCGFGISYDSMHPKNLAVVGDWQKLGELHVSLHQTAGKAFAAMQAGEKEEAKIVFLHMKDISDEILALCDAIQKAVKLLEKKKESVFLTSDSRG